MLPGFDYKEQYLGTGDTVAYPFSFFVTDPSHIHVYIQDDKGNIVTDTTADDASVVASVTFDNDENDGNVLTLVTELQNNYVLTMFTANDWPDQPTDYPNKFSFTLKDIEGSFDYLVSLIQRVAFLAQRAVRLHDLDDIDGFDMRLPMGLSDNPKAALIINTAGNGFAIGPSFDEFAQEVTDAATAAEASATAALASQTAAAASAVSASTSSGVALAAEAATLAAIAAAPFSGQFVKTGPFASIAPGANLNLPGETTDHTVYTMVDYIVRIKRGSTTGYARQEFSIMYYNGQWDLVLGPDRYDDNGVDHNVTFTVNSGTGQINAAVASDGGASAVIDIYKINWAL